MHSQGFAVLGEFSIIIIVYKPCTDVCVTDGWGCMDLEGKAMSFGTEKNENRGLGLQSPLQNFHFIVRSLIAYSDEELKPFRFHLGLVGVRGRS
jgi:hypothetical protein